MRILAFSDLHGDWTTGGLERLGELSCALDQILAYASARSVDLAIFLGDLCDPDVAPELAHRAIARAVELDGALAAAGISRRWITGNHDAIDDGLGSHTLMAIAKAGSRVHAAPANEIIHVDRGLVELVYLPYPSRSRRYDPSCYVRDLAASKRLGMRGGSLIVCGHMTEVPGASAGSETADMPRGADMPFPLDACRELAQAGGYDRTVLMNGHFHRRSVDGPVLIPGSLARLTHGEEGHAPGFLVVDV